MPVPGASGDEGILMIKLIFAARRRPGMPPEAFAEYWTSIHAELARVIPGVTRYVINLAASSRSADDRPFDGFAEITYASREELRAAADSPQVRAVLADEPNLFDPASVVRMFVTEHVIV
jgi:uncharacterized protein (TIGR02118 family)